MGKPIFAQLDHDLHNNPKVRKAGRDGRDVFVFVLCKNASRGFQGWIPARYLEVDYLAGQLGCSEAEAANGIALAIKAELIAIEGDAAVLVGWSEEYGRGPMTDAERQRRHRATSAAGTGIQRDCNDSRDGQKAVDIQGTVTNGRDMSRGHECHASEKRREEKKRESVRDTNAPADRSAPAPLVLVADPVPEKPRKRRSPETTLPADWKPSATARAPDGVDLAYESDQFRDYHAAKGSTFVDWDAAFRTWLRRSTPRRGPSGTGPPQPAPFVRAHKPFPS